MRGSFRSLSASVGAPEPHDFAVRTNTARRANELRPAMCVHRIPLPTSVTIASRPSLWVRDKREHRFDLPDNAMPGACDTLARRANDAGEICTARHANCSSFRDAQSAGPESITTFFNWISEDRDRPIWRGHSAEDRFGRAIIGSRGYGFRARRVAPPGMTEKYFR